jgi:hypothetical protein
MFRWRCVDFRRGGIFDLCSIAPVYTLHYRVGSRVDMSRFNLIQAPEGKYQPSISTLQFRRKPQHQRHGLRRNFCSSCQGLRGPGRRDRDRSLGRRRRGGVEHGCEAAEGVAADPAVGDGPARALHPRTGPR